MTASVAEVQRAGVTIEAEEAVAIAQQLIDVLARGSRAASAEPPYGPPTAATVIIGDDGSIDCRGCEATPAVSEIAILLQAMLPPQTRVPGALRYTMARALLDVDVPPFDSLADLSDTLARYERGPRALVIARVMERFAGRRTVVPMVAADRRRHPEATALRRALRDADARLYLQKVATEGIAGTIASPRPQPRSPRAAIACVAAGLALIISGEYIDRSNATEDPAPRAATGPADATVVARDISLPEPEREGLNPEPRTLNLNLGPGALNPERRIVSPDKHRPRRQPSIPRSENARSGGRKPSRSVLDRLRLGWLRTALRSL